MVSETVVVGFMIPKESRGAGSVRLQRREGIVRVYAGMARLALRLPPDGDVEQALVAALEHGNDSVRLAAASALGEVGTARAVLGLRALALGAWNHQLSQRRVALRAIADIQSRLTGAAPGQITLSTPSGGELSPAGEGGEVSLTGDPRRTRS